MACTHRRGRRRRSVRSSDKDRFVLVTATIFVACLSVGVWAASRWLPDLAAGGVGGLAFFVVCGLLGGALTVVGLTIYEIVQDINAFGGVERTALVSAQLATMLLQAGSLSGLAAVVYLLAPGRSGGDRAAAPSP
jgi:hypothetical protein